VLGARPDKAALRAPGGGEGGAADGASSSSSAAPAQQGATTAPAGGDEVQRAAAAFIDWLCAQLRRPSDPTRAVPAAVHALARLLREPPLRAMLHRAGGVQLLAPLVTMPPHGGGQLNIQLLYEATLCCWELSFHKPAADVLCGSTNVVGALVDMVRTAQVSLRLASLPWNLERLAVGWEAAFDAAAAALQYCLPGQCLEGQRCRQFSWEPGLSVA
jgi:V-type H+-transporting ATPase subunit H